ncbi:hypothetical protein, partial, partial [Parasitella parasitica]
WTISSSSRSSVSVARLSLGAIRSLAVWTALTGLCSLDMVDPESSHRDELHPDPLELRPVKASIYEGLQQGRDPCSALFWLVLVFPVLLSPLLKSLVNGSLHRPDPGGAHPDDWTLDFVSASGAPAPVKLLSYADDLEVFLSCPDEWPVLLSLLELYGRASNAKVNLGKTVLVSLSGRPHSAWAALAHTAGLKWHDALSSGAVRYLGHPLYHTDSQQSDF